MNGRRPCGVCVCVGGRLLWTHNVPSPPSLAELGFGSIPLRLRRSSEFKNGPEQTPEQLAGSGVMEVRSVCYCKPRADTFSEAEECPFKINWHLHCDTWVCTALCCAPRHQGEGCIQEWGGPTNHSEGGYYSSLFFPHHKCAL